MPAPRDGDPTQCDLYSTCLCWEFVLGVTQILTLAFGVMQNLVFLDTNMFVSPMQILVLGVLPSANPKQEGFYVAVECRLY